jgi:hypothetical protein
MFGKSKKEEEEEKKKKIADDEKIINQNQIQNQVPQQNNQNEDRIQNSIEATRLKLEQANNELKTHLLNYRNAHNQKIKEGFKLKASNALKKKKLYENQLSSLESSQFTFETMKIQSEMMKDQMNVVKTMKETGDAQKSLMNQMNIDSMWDIAMNMREMQDDMEEMNEVFQESYKVDVDDDLLDAELDELDFNMKDNFNPAQLSAKNQKVLSKKEIDEKQLEDELF